MAEKKEIQKVQAQKVQVKSKEIKEVKEISEVKEVQPAAQAANYVYIGKKEVMAYVLAVVTQFGMGAKEVIVKARGKSISRAVDVAEIIKNRDNTMKIVAINTATEEVVTQEGRPLKVSSIEIVLTK